MCWGRRWWKWGDRRASRRKPGVFDQPRRAYASTLAPHQRSRAILRDGTRHAKSNIVRLEIRCAGIVGHGSAMERPRTPRAATHHRIARLTRLLVDATIGAPFPDVAEHVVQSPGVGAQLPHGLAATALGFVFGIRCVGHIEPGILRLILVGVA